MHFDVPKFVRSPGCDHVHDEESRNGRDIKIDILEAYIWISEVFRVKSGFYRSTGGYRTPREVMVLLGLSGEERGQPRGGARPPLPQSKLDKGRGGARGPALAASPLLPLRPIKAHVPPGGFR